LKTGTVLKFCSIQTMPPLWNPSWLVSHPMAVPAPATSNTAAMHMVLRARAMALNLSCSWQVDRKEQHACRHDSCVSTPASTASNHCTSSAALPSCGAEKLTAVDIRLLAVSRPAVCLLLLHFQLRHIVCSACMRMAHAGRRWSAKVSAYRWARKHCRMCRPTEDEWWPTKRRGR